MSEANTGTVIVRNTTGGIEADVDFYPHDTIQDLHNRLLEQDFLNKRGGGTVGGNYEFTLMPQSRQLLFTETIASLPLTPESIIEVAWTINAGA